MDRGLLQESNVEGGKGLKSEVKRLKSEVKQLKSKLKRVKSEWKHVKRGTQMKSESEQKQTGNRLRSVCISSILMINFVCFT
jgi:molecular chaperone GrpE (heat shock protein)